MPFQVLSLSGGGFLGLFSIAVLSALEERTGKPIASSFDLIAGTSVGGIIALGLAAEIPARNIQRAFEENGTQIFSNRPVPRDRIRKCLDFLRAFFSSKYSNVSLRNTIISIVGDNSRIGDLTHPVIIPAVNLTKGKPQVFKTDHHPDFKFDHLRSVVSVALATSAAPTYFPIAEIEDELFADGGIYANAPDLLALHEAEFFFNRPTAEIRMLSVGTTTAQFSFSHVGKRNLGIYGWHDAIVQTLISSQQLDASYMVGHKLGDRYLRIDAMKSDRQVRDLALDVATVDAQRTIRGMATAAVQQFVNNPMLDTMLSHSAPQAEFYHRMARNN